MSIPTYIAEQISKSLYSMMLKSSLLSAIFSLTGLFISYQYDITSGAAIIVVSSIGLLLFLLFRKIYITLKR